MPDRFLPRHWSELGKRGQILLAFGVIWVGFGVGVLLAPTPPVYDLIPLISGIPGVGRGVAWILTGGIAVFYAWRPRRMVDDRLPFVMLYLMPAYRVVALTVSAIDYLLPGFGPGYSRGLIAALPFAGLVAAVMICASWLEPPVERWERVR